MGRSDQGVAASRGRWQVVPRTLSFVTHQDDVLLLKGAPDKPIWPGKYNGVGGHVERDEDILQAAHREIREETGLEVNDIRLRGVVNIDAGEEEQAGIAMFVFTARAAARQATPSHEGTLEWHPQDHLPQADLVEDLATILPRALAMPDDAPPFFAHYWYDNADNLQIDITDDQSVFGGEE
jgi:8-oxo-dGTP diphosphatase